MATTRTGKRVTVRSAKDHGVPTATGHRAEVRVKKAAA